MRKRKLALGILLIFLISASGVSVFPNIRGDKAAAGNGALYKQVEIFGQVLEQVRAAE